MKPLKVMFASDPSVARMYGIGTELPSEDSPALVGD
jgi:hypothetical protein